MIELDTGEHVIFEIRKHWFVFATEVTILILMALAPIFIIAFVETVPLKILPRGGNFASLIVFLYSAWLLVLWILGFVFWTNYYLDVWIVTDKKMIDVDQRGLFKREVSILHLDKIQDITSEIHGIFATLVNFGDLHVQTAGNQREFTIRGVANPDHVRQRINDALTNHKERVRNDVFGQNV